MRAEGAIYLLVLTPLIMSSEQVVVYKYDSEKPSLYMIRKRLSSGLSYCYNYVCTQILDAY